MKKMFFFAVLGSAAAVAAVAAPRSVTITVNRTDMNNGQQMYTSYCAPCHGVDGRGDGPAAQSLKVAPADLTQLSRQNHGVYPALEVNSLLKFGPTKDSAGSSEMPYWHPVLNELDKNQAASDLRVYNLVQYIAKLQAH